jgi:hypothetical protein
VDDTHDHLHLNPQHLQAVAFFSFNGSDFLYQFLLQKLPQKVKLIVLPKAIIFRMNPIEIP